jgi:FtsZ-binding cell division protein ZapB
MSELFEDGSVLHCAICLQLFQCPRFLQCGHGFCSECLKKSLEFTKDSCPVCRKPTSSKAIRVYGFEEACIKIDGLIRETRQLEETRDQLTESNDQLTESNEQYERSVCLLRKQVQEKVTDYAILERANMLLLQKQEKNEEEIRLLKRKNNFLSTENTTLEDQNDRLQQENQQLKKKLMQVASLLKKTAKVLDNDD